MGAIVMMVRAATGICAEHDPLPARILDSRHRYETDPVDEASLPKGKIAFERYPAELEKSRSGVERRNDEAGPCCGIVAICNGF